MEKCPLPWRDFCTNRSRNVMATLRTLFWFTLFLASTFTFTVLFEHGTADFQNNAKKEFDYLSAMVGAKPEKKKDESDKIGGGSK